VVQLSVSGTVPQATWSCRISLERSHREEFDGTSPGRVVYRWKGLIAGNPMVLVTCTLVHVSDCDHAKCGAVSQSTATLKIIDLQ
jgi:hypothetical protein